MSHRFAAKKWPFKASRRYLRSLDISSGKWSASTSWQIEFSGWTAANCWPDWALRPSGRPCPDIAAAQSRLSLKLQAKAGSIALRPGQPETPIWSLQGSPPDPGLRFRRGDELEIALQNDLPVPTVLNWHGLDGFAASRTAGGAAPPRGGGQGKPSDSIASRRHLPVRPHPARRRRGAADPGAAADRRRERARRRRPRRGVPDRGLAAAPGRDRDRARASIPATRRCFTPSTG